MGSTSRLGQDLQVLETYNKKKNGYFVEIGAYDGIDASNTYLLETKYAWKGICVEPLPEAYTNLRKNRPESTCINKVVFHTSGLNVKFSMNSILSGITDTIDKFFNTKKQPNINVVTISLHDLLHEQNAPECIEYLSINTQGSEYDILKTTDFNKYSFGVIHIEHNFVEPKRRNIWKLLLSNGYKHIKNFGVCDAYIHKSLLETIVIAPNGGFGNRIRAMASACCLAEKLDMRLFHVWNGDPYVCYYPHVQKIHDASFEHFFESPITRYGLGNLGAIDVCYSEWQADHNWHSTQNYGQTMLQIKNIKRLHDFPYDVSKSFMIESSLNFLNFSPSEMHSMYKKYFLPKQSFLDHLSELPEKTVGVHIRRLEFYEFFNTSEICDNVLFRWLEKLEQPAIVFSDDKDYKSIARAHLRKPVTLSFESSDQSSEDMAFLEFLTLSRCSLVYGTKNSSFSEEAAHFGNVPYQSLTDAVSVLA